MATLLVFSTLGAVKPSAATPDGEKVSYTLTGEGSMGDFITGYLNPFFEKPATVITENGKKYAYVTITGKMYGASVIQVVNSDGTRTDVEVVSVSGEKMDQVRVIKFPLNSAATRLFIDGGTYGSYTVQLKFDIGIETPKEPEAPKEKPKAPTVTVKKVTKKSTVVQGTTEAKATVYVYKGSKKLGSAKANSKGVYKVKIKKQKTGTKLKVFAKNSAGKGKVKTVTVKAK